MHNLDPRRSAPKQCARAPKHSLLSRHIRCQAATSWEDRHSLQLRIVPKPHPLVSALYLPQSHLHLPVAAVSVLHFYTRSHLELDQVHGQSLRNVRVRSHSGRTCHRLDMTDVTARGRHAAGWVPLPIHMPHVTVEQACAYSDAAKPQACHELSSVHWALLCMLRDGTTTEHAEHVHW